MMITRQIQRCDPTAHVSIATGLVGPDDDLIRRYPTIYFASIAGSDGAADSLVEAFDGVVRRWS
jgi:hypothetical protein